MDNKLQLFPASRQKILTERKYGLLKLRYTVSIGIGIQIHEKDYVMSPYSNMEYSEHQHHLKFDIFFLDLIR